MAGAETQQFADLSEIYNREPYRGISRSRAERMTSLLKPFVNKTYMRTLDLGCGNGISSEVFSTLGTVIGIDLSLISLRKAREQTANPNQYFVLQDINQLGFMAGSFDIVASMFDTLNYLDPESLAKLAASVRGCLKHRGLFCLNFLTPEAFGDLKTRPDTITEGNGFYFLSRATGSSNTQVSLDLIAFIKTDDEKAFRLIKETHNLFIHKVSTVIENLSRCGLQVIKTVDGETLATNYLTSAWNVMVIARKV